MVGKRHASGEIKAKLAQANELVARGKTQREISKALGVSIMTYHRWKKMLPSADLVDDPIVPNNDVAVRPRSLGDMSSADKIKHLELENARLRRLVTDMLLEKLDLQEELQLRQEQRLRRPDNG